MKWAGMKTHMDLGSQTKAQNQELRHLSYVKLDKQV